MTTSLEQRKREIVRLLLQQQTVVRDALYGQLIIQANEVHYKLAFVVFLNSSFPENKYRSYLFERAEFGSLISLFQACIQRTPEMRQLLGLLKNYQTKRNRLAHHMYSSKVLTPVECKKAIIIGKQILSTMDKTIESIKVRLGL